MDASRKLTIRQEKFCLAYVETGCAAEAYRRAYNAENYKPNSLYVKAHMTLKKDKIGLRIAALKARQLQRHDVTVDGLTTQLDEIRSHAVASGKYGAGVRAVMVIARLHGLDRQQTQVAIKYERTPEERLIALQNLLAAASQNATPLA